MALAGTHYELETLPDGVYRHTQYAKRVGYYGNGALRRITNSVSSTGDPSFPIGVDEAFQCRFANRIAGISPIVHFGLGTEMVRIAPLGAKNNTLAQIVSPNTVRYNGAWTNADLQYTIAGHYVDKRVYLHTGHPSSFQFQFAQVAGFNAATLRFGDAFYIADPVLIRDDSDETVPLSWDIAQVGPLYTLTVVLPPGDFANWILDPTLVLQPGVADGKDAWISGRTAATQANNYGATVYFEAGEITGGVWGPERSLIQFDLSSIPTSATVSSAVLSLVLQGKAATNNRAIRAYRLQSGRDWGEGAGNGAAVGAGECSWNFYANPAAWGTAGCANTTTDREATDIGSRTMLAADVIGNAFTWTLTASKVQEWISGAFANNGMLLKADTETDDCYVFHSSEAVTALYHPKLTVDYFLPGHSLKGLLRSPIIH